MEIIPIKTGLLAKSADLYSFVVVSLLDNELELSENDILAVSSKIFSYSENSIFEVDSKEEFEKEVQKESEKYVKGKIVDLSRKNGWWVANAGIDKSNAPVSEAIKWVKDPQKSCDELRGKLIHHYGLKNLGIIMVDSFCTPGRLGVTGGAIAVSGFKPVIDQRGQKDIYGQTLKITQVAVADMLAAGANLLMGEANEQIPICLIRDYNAEFVGKKFNSIALMQIDPKDCLFNPIYHE